MVAGSQEKRWQQFDPFRLPDWRWQLAGRVARDEVPHGHVLDDVTEAAVAFRQAHELPEAHAGGRRHLGSHDEDIAAALKLYEDGAPLAWEVHARILARQDDAEIAAHCGVAANVLGLYVLLFYDVRECQDSWGYLLAYVVGRGHINGFKDDDVGGFWAWAALYGGPLILDRLVTTFHAVHPLDQPPKLSDYLCPNAGVDVRLQSFVASSVLPPCGASAAVLTDMHLRLVEADSHGSGAAAEVRQDLIRHARAFLAGEPLAVVLPIKPAGRQRRAKVRGQRKASASTPTTMAGAAWEMTMNRVSAARKAKVASPPPRKRRPPIVVDVRAEPISDEAGSEPAQMPT